MTGPKLNSFVSKGPNYMNSIPELTLAFRRGKYVIMADVKQQFHQLKIHPEDHSWAIFTLGILKSLRQKSRFTK